MNKFIIPLILLSLILIQCKPENHKETIMDSAKFHKSIFVADTHSDTPLRLMRGENIANRTESGHMDLPRLLEGGVDCQVFAIWTNPFKEAGEKGWKKALNMIKAVNQFCSENEEKISLCRTITEVESTNAEDKIAIMLGVEGGQIIDHHIERLDTLYNFGVRYITITWNYSQDWATAAIDESGEKELKHRGLTDFGREVIRKMDDLGIMIDVSHSGEQTFWDIINTSKNPIIASHSCVFNLANHFRNLKDDQIEAIARRGGVIFVNFYSGYLDGNFEKKWETLADSLQPEIDNLKKMYPDMEKFREKRRELFRPYLDKFNPDINRIIDHIEYIAGKVGCDYVGIGSDFDGVSVLPKGMEDVTDLPKITDLLLKRGFSKEDVAKIMGGNFKRVFRQVIGN